MKTKQVRRWVALLLVAAMVAVVPAGAADRTDAVLAYADASCKDGWWVVSDYLGHSNIYTNEENENDVIGKTLFLSADCVIYDGVRFTSPTVQSRERSYDEILSDRTDPSIFGLGEKETITMVRISDAANPENELVLYLCSDHEAILERKSKYYRVAYQNGYADTTGNYGAPVANINAGMCAGQVVALADTAYCVIERDGVRTLREMPANQTVETSCEQVGQLAVYGNYLYYSDCQSDDSGYTAKRLYRMDLQTKTHELLYQTTGKHGRFDSFQIANGTVYLSCNYGDTVHAGGVRRLNLETGTCETLYAPAVFGIQVYNGRICCFSQEGITLIDLASGRRTVVLSDALAYNGCADRDFAYYYDEADRTICRIPLTGGAAQVVCTMPETVDSAAEYMMVEGDTLYFVCPMRAQAEETAARLFSCEKAGGDPVMLADDVMRLQYSRMMPIVIENQLYYQNVSGAYTALQQAGREVPGYVINTTIQQMEITKENGQKAGIDGSLEYATFSPGPTVQPRPPTLEPGLQIDLPMDTYTFLVKSEGENFWFHGDVDNVLFTARGLQTGDRITLMSNGDDVSGIRICCKAEQFRFYYYRYLDVDTEFVFGVDLNGSKTGSTVSLEEIETGLLLKGVENCTLQLQTEGRNNWVDKPMLLEDVRLDGHAALINTQTGKITAFVFDDVQTSAWCHDAVRFVNDHDYMTGVSDTEFQPNGTMTRAMLVTTLYRMSGATDAGAPTFTDVPADTWYTNAVAWAEKNNIVNGTGDKTFSPNARVTREQVAAILYRYAQFAGKDVSVGEDTNILSFADAFELSEYAIPAMQWACGAGVISGKDESHIDSQGTATRAEVATMLMRFEDGKTVSADAPKAAVMGKDLQLAPRVVHADTAAGKEVLQSLSFSLLGACYLDAGEGLRGRGYWVIDATADSLDAAKQQYQAWSAEKLGGDRIAMSFAEQAAAYGRNTAEGQRLFAQEEITAVSKDGSLLRTEQVEPGAGAALSAATVRWRIYQNNVVAAEAVWQTNGDNAPLDGPIVYTETEQYWENMRTGKQLALPVRDGHFSQDGALCARFVRRASAVVCEIFRTGEMTPQHVYDLSPWVSDPSALEIYQVEGTATEGFVLFRSGKETWRLDFPSGEITVLGEYLFHASLSPDQKYLAYTALHRFYQADVANQTDDAEQTRQEIDAMPYGVYICDLETQQSVYFPAREHGSDDEYALISWFQQN